MKIAVMIISDVTYDLVYGPSTEIRAYLPPPTLFVFCD